MHTFFEVIKEIGIASWSIIQEQQDVTLSRKNIHGDVQTRFDVLIDDLIVERFRKARIARTLLSEEREEPVLMEGDPDLSIHVDPVDGSKHSLVNGAFGSLFALYKDRHVIAAAYLHYGPRVVLVAAESQVDEYLLSGQSFLKSEEGIQVPAAKQLVLGGLYNGYPPKLLEYVTQMLADGYYFTYSHPLICNLHNILKKGGVYAYPKTRLYPDGKIRLYTEAKTVAFIIEKAGGRATDGVQRILDKEGGYKDKTALFFGDPALVQEILGGLE
ncbi:hypothetical protein H6504_05035 [Candidatus Woesearchaeota archaeon]|nr:hypothetical protein [Candidatus Woesearchaeota archaeon]